MDDLGWLMEEPFGMSPDHVAKLTDAQIVGLWGRQRDAKTGVAKPVGPQVRRKFSTPEQAKEQWVSLLQTFGKSQAEAEAAWEKGRSKEV